MSWPRRAASPLRRDSQEAAASAPLDWLRHGPAFVRYRTLVDLLGRDEAHPEAERAYAEMTAAPLVTQLVAEVNDWEHQPVIKRHTNAAHPLHKLVFAADLGLRRRALAPAVRSILAHQSKDGPFQVRIMVPPAMGGDGLEKWDWVATDAPLVLFALLRLGVRNAKVTRGVEHVLPRVAEPGFPCFASSSLPKLKGPGSPRRDPCPYANLIVLRMLAELPDRVDGPEARAAVDMLLRHWELRGKRKYFMFGIGSDFAKPKAPLIWYDLLHFADTLTRFPCARRDPRLDEVLALLRSTLDGEGRVTPGSVWMKWKGWEFCQKREPSYWLTFLAHRALRRCA